MELLSEMVYIKSLTAVKEESAFRQVLGLLKPGNRAVSLILALLVLISVALPLQKAEWGEGLPPLILLAFMGASLAFFLNNRLSSVLTHLLSLLTGSLIILIMATLATPGHGFFSRLINLLWELGIWIYAVQSGEIQGGNIEFIIILLSLFWVMGYATVWQVLRHHQWWATVLPTGGVLLLTLYNLPEEYYFYFPVYLALSFLLIAHITIGKRQEKWQKSYIPLSTPLRYFHLLFVIAFVFIGISMAWKIPSIKYAPFTGAINKLEAPYSFIEYHFGRLFASLPARKPILSLKWGENHSFGGPPQLSENLLFTIMGKNEPLYWRAKVYDKYNSQGWFSSPTFLQTFDTNILQIPEEGVPAERIQVKHNIRLNAVTDTLFSAGIPFSSDTEAQLAGRENAPWDILQIRSMIELHINQKYEIQSLISTATPEQMKKAGKEYPQWVKENYLQIPRTLPLRVRELSKQITSSANNPYEAAITIRDYLKKTYPYSLKITPPAKGSDGVDYFLFTQKAGYCDYFASAMAIMLRSTGIPARLVVGFAPGEWDDSKQGFIVRDLNYHSWPEVYFPGYGWIEFEPTPPEALEFSSTQQRLIGIAGGSAEEDEESFEGETIPVEQSKFAFLNDINSLKGYIVFSLLLAILLLILAYYILWGRLSNLGYPAVVYAKMCRLSFLAGHGPKSHQTPQEYARALSLFMPSQSTSINLITKAYMEAQYSPHKFLDYIEQEKINRVWKPLRNSLIKRLIRPMNSK